MLKLRYRFFAANNLPLRLNSVRRQISTALPLDEVSTIDNLHKFVMVLKLIQMLHSASRR